MATRDVKTDRSQFFASTASGALPSTNTIFKPFATLFSLSWKAFSLLRGAHLARQI
jgi:hypothetical protein